LGRFGERGPAAFGGADGRRPGALQTLDPASLPSLGQSADLSKLDALLEEWDA
jgi:hypothetical protein